eukprot:s6654_g4.t1
MAGKARPLRLDTRSISCATLYAGQSFMEAQADVKEEDSRMGREDIEQDLRAAQRVLDDLKARARKLEAECKESGHGAGMAAPVEPASSRPVATPARADAPKKCIHRPVSSDAQPRSYTFWERAFPEEEETQLDPPEPADPAAATSPNAPKNPKSSGALAPDFHELRQLLQENFVKQEEEESMTPTDAFNQRMEVVIRNVKEGKVVIDSGYYSEAAMKTELKRDKYQKHIVEYWIDLKTSGSLSRSHKEEFNQFIEIIDDAATLPPPVLGSEALPCYEEEDDAYDDDDDSEEDDDNDDGKGSSTPTTKRKRSKRSRRTPGSAKSKRKREEKAHEVETALEAWSGKTLSQQAEELLRLHDELAEIRAENGKNDPSKEFPI